MAEIGDNRFLINGWIEVNFIKHQRPGLVLSPEFQQGQVFGLGNFPSRYK
jgi:hypothetical protein